MIRRLVFISAAIVLLTVVSANAHHSIAGYYDGSQEVTVEGLIFEFHFVNPHPFLLMDVTAPNGPTQKWKLEMDNRSELAQIGVKNETFKRGDRVVVKGSPARAQAQSLYVWKLDRPADGLRYEQIGMSPHLRYIR